jgi:hypothetical protein
MPLDVRVDGKVITLAMTNGTGETQAGVAFVPSSKIHAWEATRRR